MTRTSDVAMMNEMLDEMIYEIEMYKDPNAEWNVNRSGKSGVAGHLRNSTNNKINKNNSKNNNANNDDNKNNNNNKYNNNNNNNNININRNKNENKCSNNGKFNNKIDNNRNNKINRRNNSSPDSEKNNLSSVNIKTDDETSNEDIDSAKGTEDEKATKINLGLKDTNIAKKTCSDEEFIAKPNFQLPRGNAKLEKNCKDKTVNNRNKKANSSGQNNRNRKNTYNKKINNSDKHYNNSNEHKNNINNNNIKNNINGTNNNNNDRNDNESNNNNNTKNYSKNKTNNKNSERNTKENNKNDLSTTDNAKIIEITNNEINENNGSSISNNKNVNTTATNDKEENDRSDTSNVHLIDRRVEDLHTAIRHGADNKVISEKVKNLHKVMSQYGILQDDCLTILKKMNNNWVDSTKKFTRNKGWRMRTAEEGIYENARGKFGEEVDAITQILLDVMSIPPVIGRDFPSFEELTSQVSDIRKRLIDIGLSVEAENSYILREIERKLTNEDFQKWVQSLGDDVARRKVTTLVDWLDDETKQRRREQAELRGPAKLYKRHVTSYDASTQLSSNCESSRCGRRNSQHSYL